MPAVTSRDGTTIAFDKQGSGPALIVVDGALTTRRSESKPKLVELLSPRLAVYTYDRRGRGDSGDTPPYSVQREIEDIAAIVAEAGGSASVYGHSSGGCLALEAALGLGPGRVSRLAIYEAPYDDDPAIKAPWQKYRTDVTAAVADGRRGDAAALFMAYVGTPRKQIDVMRRAPFWPAIEAVALTLAYDAAVLGSDKSVPVERASRIAVPTLIMHGAAGAPFMGETARTLRKAIPGAQLRTLAGQGHNVRPEALAPVLAEFVGQ